jgi:hypothetical protein
LSERGEASDHRLRRACRIGGVVTTATHNEIYMDESVLSGNATSIVKGLELSR